MIVPEFWAEGRIQHRKQGKQITVRRFGWSDTSQEEAQSNADQRAREALDRILSGQKLLRHEWKVPYNGGQGVPIREEIVERYGETIITRNSYGALCLNTPNVLFVDVDFETEPNISYVAVSTLCFCILGGVIGWFKGFILLWIVVGGFFGSAVPGVVHKAMILFRGGKKAVALNNVNRFLGHHPEWSAALYRTPAGYRVLVTHRTFDPPDPEVADFFKSLGVDPIYQRMCLNQQCFRARLTAKPWRIGIESHMKPRPGVWPVNPERLPQRNEWIAKYEEVAKDYAACKFIAAYGSGKVDPVAEQVQRIHDEISAARSDLPIA